MKTKPANVRMAAQEAIRNDTRTDAEIAVLLGMDASTVFRWRAPKGRPPATTTARRIVATLAANPPAGATAHR